MSDKIQMTEEQFKTMISDVFESVYLRDWNGLVSMARRKGYILKSAVEEAEEMYHNWNQSKPKFIYDDFMEVKNLCVILYEAMQELKAENERLKCLKP